mgnify:CR=1 FL=1
MSGDTYPIFKAAAVQAAPVFLDRDATIDKACALIERAAALGAELVVFPEVFVPAYPLWSFLYPPMETHGFFHRLFRNAVKVPSPQTDKLGETARRCGVIVSIGVNEKTDVSMGAIWNANLIFDHTGAIVHRHRKLVPTFVEKLSWANGDGSGLRTVDTRVGRLGLLICGENTNPLARFALLAQGEQVHLSTYPPAFPARRPGAQGEYDLGHAIRVRAGAHSFEGKVFTVVASGALDELTVKEVAQGDDEKRAILQKTPRPVSVILNPNADVIAGPLDEPEGIVVGEIDINQIVEWKQIHDVVGYYNRFDIFRLRVNRAPNRPLEIVDGDAEGGSGERLQ